MTMTAPASRDLIDHLVKGGWFLQVLDDGRVLLMVGHVMSAPQAAGYGKSLMIMAQQAERELAREDGT